MFITGSAGMQRLAVLGITLCGLLGSRGVANAALVAGGGAIHGCVGRNGALRVIASGRHRCRRGEQTIVFDEQGTQGPAGPQGSPADTNEINALKARVGGLESTTSALQQNVSALQSQNMALVSREGALEGTLAGVTRSGSTLRFTGMNLQLLSGSGATDGPVNGLGNMIIGYNEDSAGQIGSHNLILGRDQTFTSYGGLDAGLGNTITGSYASITGGTASTASSPFASVSGGSNNLAEASSASITAVRTTWPTERKRQ